MKCTLLCPFLWVVQKIFSYIFQVNKEPVYSRRLHWEQRSFWPKSTHSSPYSLQWQGKKEQACCRSNWCSGLEPPRSHVSTRSSALSTSKWFCYRGPNNRSLCCSLVSKWSQAPVPSPPAIELIIDEPLQKVTPSNANNLSVVKRPAVWPQSQLFSWPVQRSRPC